jgi:hypothetical protein
MAVKKGKAPAMTQSRNQQQKSLVKELTKHAIDRLMPEAFVPVWDESIFPEKVALMLRGVALGLDIETSITFAGWNNFDYSDWLSRGSSMRSRKPVAEPESPYIEFCEYLEMAVATAKATAVFVVAAAIRNGSVPAAQWWLERRARKEYSTGAELPQEIRGALQTITLVLPDNGRADAPAMDKEMLESDLEENEDGSWHLLGTSGRFR